MNHDYELDRGLLRQSMYRAITDAIAIEHTDDLTTHRQAAVEALSLALVVVAQLRLGLSLDTSRQRRAAIALEDSARVAVLSVAGCATVGGPSMHGNRGHIAKHEGPMGLFTVPPPAAPPRPEKRRRKKKD